MSNGLCPSWICVIRGGSRWLETRNVRVYRRNVVDPSDRSTVIVLRLMRRSR